MITAAVIGSYKLTRFVELGILRLRRVWPDIPILISDDLSTESNEIERLAARHGVDYTCPRRRRSHFSGDAQAILNAIVYGRECGADVALKLSQRLVIVRPEFRTALELAFSDPEVQIAIPGRIPKKQISRPSSKFYTRFGLLSDAIAIRPSAIEPEDFLTIYRERCAVGRHPSDSFVETSLGYLLAHKFQGNKHRLIPEWTEHKMGSPKIFLRKSQSSASDYAQLARMEGLSGDVSLYDCREWREIEGHGYKAKADIV